DARARRSPASQVRAVPPGSARATTMGSTMKPRRARVRRRAALRATRSDNVSAKSHVFKKPVRIRISSGMTGKGFNERGGGHEWRPEPLCPKLGDEGCLSWGAGRETSDGSRVQNEYGPGISPHVSHAAGGCGALSPAPMTDRLPRALQPRQPIR